ncbi:growth factor receptor-bound protein 14 isoform X3 [Coregonus clupeaformis]|uniref:growth factor receptor-bound protein 14 isoform X3 n=1 Tax=Coregonus clupeaformis TaxID=59861 RepID=UPI001BDFA49E|nr:growth factor receptor-bound protein 14 isoform X3 [Coregonus clupeaformis]
MSDMSNTLEDIHTSDSLGEKAEIFGSGKGNVSGFSSPSLIPLHAPLQPPNAQLSRTAVCQGNRKIKEGEESLLAAPVPSLFPELIPSTVSSLVSDCLLPWTKSGATQLLCTEERSMNFHARRVTLPAITPLCLQKRVIKVYTEDNTSRAVEVPTDITARDICQLFVLKNHCIDDHSWTLFEHLSHLGIERIIEDHESVMEVLSGWGMDTDSRLYFRKNYAKYEFFNKPLDSFPDHMVSISSETNGMMNHSQLIQTFLNSSTCPEIHGHLHAKEQGRKSWKKFYFVLRRSGLYFSNKGTSKEPRHLQFIAEFSDSDVYTFLSARKIHGAPTDYGFCVKSTKCGSPRDLKLLCADDEQTRTCWVTAMRLFKYGMQLYQNFIQPHQKQKTSPMYLRELLGGHGLLRTQEPGDREPIGGAVRSRRGGALMEEEKLPPSELSWKPVHLSESHVKHSSPYGPALVPQQIVQRRSTPLNHSTGSD